jgi:hypothetical protein
MTLKELVPRLKVSSEYGRVSIPWDKLDDWQKGAHQYRVTVRYGRRRIAFDWFAGQAITDTPEDRPEDVLDSLLSDAQAGEQEFDEFCQEFGYDADSRKAERTWKACQRSGAKLRRLLGDEFETWLYAERS